MSARTEISEAADLCGCGNKKTAHAIICTDCEESATEELLNMAEHGRTRRARRSARRQLQHHASLRAPISRDHAEPWKSLRA